MKKNVLIGLILFVSTLGINAIDLEVGPSITLKYPISLSDDLSVFSGIGIEDIKVGADIELGIGILQFGALVDYKPSRRERGYISPASIETLVTGGVLFDIFFLRAGVGVGPTLVYDIIPKDAPEREDGSLGMGLGLKVNTDLVIGSFILRLNLISSLDMLRGAVAEDVLEYMDVKVGISTLFSL